MRILFDQGTPHPLRHCLSGHVVETSVERGWSRFENGDLLREAEVAGFEVLVTTDQNLRCQQNLTGRKLAIVVLLTTSWPKMQTQLARIQQAVNEIAAGDYVEVPF